MSHTGKKTEEDVKQEWGKGAGVWYLAPTCGSSYHSGSLSVFLFTMFVVPTLVTFRNLHTRPEGKSLLHSAVIFSAIHYHAEDRRAASFLVTTKVTQTHHFFHSLPLQSASTLHLRFPQTRRSLCPAKLEIVPHSLLAVLTLRLCVTQ